MKTKNTPLVYESLCTIDRSFEQVLRELERLDHLDCFRGRAPLKSVELAVRETRAWTLSEILDVLHEREEGEWMRLGRLRGAQEKPQQLRSDVGGKPTARKRRAALQG